MSIFKKIIEINNIKQAYIELSKKFYEESKTFNYSGIDGITINEFDLISNKILKEIQHDLINFLPLQLAKCVYIPKENDKFREIYIYSIKDRIKAQAVYRIIEPLLEKEYSNYLFSYRSSHPSYYAARSIARRYKRYYKEDYVGVIDISNYAYTINSDLLLNEFKKLNFENKTIHLLKTFIKSKSLKNAEVFENKITGPLTGLPLDSLFFNIYLNDLDKYIGKKVSLYRRVGDDLIMFDKNEKKMKEIFQYAKNEISSLNLLMHPEKTKLIKATNEFSFIGYNFNNGKIRFKESYFKKLKISWAKKFLTNKPKIEKEKVRKIKRIIYRNKIFSFKKEIEQIVSQKILINDFKQIKKLDKHLIKVLTKLFFNKYSYRNERLLKNKLKYYNIELPKLYKSYLDKQNGKK